MLLQRHGLPEEEELVLCTVTSVQYHSVFATLDEFGGKTGMIHISEVAPGRIRNIREFVQEGKKVVCKVLKLDRERDRIDLSLRRVNERERRSKMDLIRREQQAEKILEYFSTQQKQDFKKVYEEMVKVFLDPTKEEHFLYLSDVFDDVVNRGLDLGKAGLKGTLAKPLTELIKTRIKPPEVHIEGKLTLKTYAPNGVEVIKKGLGKIKDEAVKIAYLGGGSYSIRVRAKDYRIAEKKLKSVTDDIYSYSKKNKIEADFTRAKA